MKRRSTPETDRQRAVVQGHGWALVRALDDALGALADHGFTTRVAALARRPAP